MPAYLILRDVFPEWAADIGVMRRGLAFRLFMAVADFQYRTADVIGVQAAGNLSYFHGRLQGWLGRVEVLENWLAAPPVVVRGPFRVADTRLAQRKIFVYAGNMGVAQQMDKLIDTARALLLNSHVGFLFVGRGSELARLKGRCIAEGIHNVLFIDEIEPDEIPGLLAQCHCGLISLDGRHRSHNIPGKLLTYLQAGLPILATINDGNDLEKLVLSERVGRVSVASDGNDLPQLLETMMSEDLNDPGIAGRCRSVWQKHFSPQSAAQQIVLALEAARL